MQDLIELGDIGNMNVTPETVVRVIAFLASVYVVVWVVRRVIVRRLLTRTDVDVGVRYAISRIAGYVIWIVALFIGLPMVGIELSSLALAFATLGIGVGLGLQGIAKDFVSGLILIFERPVAVGDRVEIGGTVGTVMEIAARVTQVRTNENVDILVPNSEFVSERVVNLSRAEKVTRLRFSVGVSYLSEPEEVRECLLAVAREHPAVIKDPEPDVLFMEFGDSALIFVLRVYTRKMLYYPDRLRSQINFAIWRKLKSAGIQIPFPQRDLHLKSVSAEAAERLQGEASSPAPD